MTDPNTHPGFDDDDSDQNEFGPLEHDESNASDNPSDHIDDVRDDFHDEVTDAMNNVDDSDDEFALPPNYREEADVPPDAHDESEDVHNQERQNASNERTQQPASQFEREQENDPGAYAEPEPQFILNPPPITEGNTTPKLATYRSGRESGTLAVVGDYAGRGGGAFLSSSFAANFLNGISYMQGLALGGGEFLAGFLLSGLSAGGGALTLGGRRLAASVLHEKKVSTQFSKACETICTSEESAAEGANIMNKNLNDRIQDEEISLIDTKEEQDVLKALHATGLVTFANTPYLGSTERYAKYVFTKFLQICNGAVNNQRYNLSQAQLDALKTYAIYKIQDPEQKEKKRDQLMQTSIEYARLIQNHHRKMRELQLQCGVWGSALAGSIVTVNPLPLLSAGVFQGARSAYNYYQNKDLHLEIGMNNQLTGKDGSPIQSPEALKRDIYNQNFLLEMTSADKLDDAEKKWAAIMMLPKDLDAKRYTTAEALAEDWAPRLQEELGRMRRTKVFPEERQKAIDPLQKKIDALKEKRAAKEQEKTKSANTDAVNAAQAAIDEAKRLFDEAVKAYEDIRNTDVSQIDKKNVLDAEAELKKLQEELGNVRMQITQKNSQIANSTQQPNVELQQAHVKCSKIQRDIQALESDPANGADNASQEKKLKLARSRLVKAYDLIRSIEATARFRFPNETIDDIAERDGLLKNEEVLCQNITDARKKVEDAKAQEIQDAGSAKTSHTAKIDAADAKKNEREQHWNEAKQKHQEAIQSSQESHAARIDTINVDIEAIKNEIKALEEEIKKIESNNTTFGVEAIGQDEDVQRAFAYKVNEIFNQMKEKRENGKEGEFKNKMKDLGWFVARNGLALGGIAAISGGIPAGVTYLLITKSAAASLVLPAGTIAGGIGLIGAGVGLYHLATSRFFDFVKNLGKKSPTPTPKPPTP